MVRVRIVPAGHTRESASSAGVAPSAPPHPLPSTGLHPFPSVERSAASPPISQRGSHGRARSAHTATQEGAPRRANRPAERRIELHGARIELRSSESSSGRREAVAELEVQGRSQPWRQRRRSSRFGPAGPPPMRDVGNLDLQSVARWRGSDGRSSIGGEAQGAAAAELARRAAAVVPRLCGFSMASAMGGVAAPVGGARGERPTTGWGLPSPPVGEGAGGDE
jgi:hypothetical protein